VVTNSSVCSVALVQPTQRVEFFGNVFTLYNVLGTLAACVKFWKAIRSVSTLSRKLNVKKCEKSAFFDQYPISISKTIQDMTVVTMEDQYELDLSNRVICNNVE